MIDLVESPTPTLPPGWTATPCGRRLRIERPLRLGSGLPSVSFRVDDPATAAAVAARIEGRLG
jgi:hypothetical protein